MKITTEIQGLERAQKRIARAQLYGKVRRADVVKSYRKVSGIFIRKARSMAKDYPEPIRVLRGKTVPITVEPGTLRRSFGNWLPNSRFPTVLAGPRANYPMKRKVAQNADAWFAHIVEEGDFAEEFGGKQQSHANYKITERAIKATKEAMRQKLYGEIRKNFMHLIK